MKNIHFIYGDDLVAINECTNDLINKLSEDCKKEIITKKFRLTNEEDIQDLLSDSFGKSLFFENNLLQLFLTYNTFKYLEKDFDPFFCLINQFSEYSTVLIVLNLEKFDKTIKSQILESDFLNKLSSKNASVEEFIKFKYWEVDKLKSKIVSLADKYGLSFENDALDLFIDCFKSQQQYIHQELKRIQTYLLPENIIKKELIQEFYINSFSIDDLFNYITSQSKNKLSFFSDYDFTKSISPLYLIASLQNKLREALSIKMYIQDGKNINNISKITGINFYRVQELANKLVYISIDYLRGVILNLSDLEYKIKSGLVKADNAINILLIQMSALKVG